MSEIERVLENVRFQLAWRSPHSLVVLRREQAETVLAYIDQLRAERAQDQQRLFHYERALATAK